MTITLGSGPTHPAPSRPAAPAPPPRPAKTRIPESAAAEYVARQLRTRRAAA